MNRNFHGSLVVVLMFILQSWASSVHMPAEVQGEVLDEPHESAEVIPVPSALNAPGFHEGTVFSEATLTAGGHHTCAILDNMSISAGGTMTKDNLETVWKHRFSMSRIAFYGELMLLPASRRRAFLLDSVIPACWLSIHTEVV